MKLLSQLVRASAPALLLAAATLSASAQGVPRNGPPMGEGSGVPGPGMRGGFGRGEHHGPPMRGGLQVGPLGRWWDNGKFATAIGIQPDQRARMDAIFEANRGTLMTLFRNLRNEEHALGPLISAEQPDESRILAQIDRVAQARAELEKASARMLLGIRRELTLDQWHRLESMRNEQMPGPPPPPER